METGGGGCEKVDELAEHARECLVHYTWVTTLFIPSCRQRLNGVKTLAKDLWVIGMRPKSITQNKWVHSRRKTRKKHMVCPSHTWCALE